MHHVSRITFDLTDLKMLELASMEFKRLQIDSEKHKTAAKSSASTANWTSACSHLERRSLEVVFRLVL